MSEKILCVTTPYFCAGAIWENFNNTWKCTEAAPIIKWMIGLNSEDMKKRKEHLKKKGWKLEWV